MYFYKVNFKTIICIEYNTGPRKVVLLITSSILVMYIKEDLYQAILTQMKTIDFLSVFYESKKKSIVT